tara:strand:- start:37432 stop:37668 length:237 start_codon:yes stop_codon:yes gene_type:complete
MLNRIIVTLYLFIYFSLESFSQGCAMCKATVETNLENGSDLGSGLNDGILYLMMMPYLAIIIFAIFYYLQKRKIKQDI